VSRPHSGSVALTAHESDLGIEHAGKMSSKSQLSPKEAIAYGLLCVAVGIAIALVPAGIVPNSNATTDQPPHWVGFCIALVFVLGGLALIVGYAVAGASGPDGDLPRDTPRLVYVTQKLLGLGIVGCLGIVFTWVSFGSGPRAFTVTGPFLASQNGGATVGRIAFGFAAAMIWLFFVALAVRARRRILKTAKLDE
jgi:hypothetical protein